ncbi:MAG: transporter substrate-binding domain-containing protein, partial [Thermocrispum sp.]
GFGDTLQRINDEGVLRVGHANERPYAYDEGGLRGAMPAVFREVFRRMVGEDIELRGVPTLFKDLIKDLNAGAYDVVVAGMFVRADRCKRAAFSAPIYCTRETLLVREGNPKDLSDYASLREQRATVAMLGGAVEQDYAKSAGVSEDRIELVGSQEEGLRLVAGGDVDALALTSISGRALLSSSREQQPSTPPPPGGEPSPSEQADAVELLEPFVPEIDGERQVGCGAAVFRKPDDDLRQAFDSELAGLLSDGSVLELTAPYGFTEAELPPEGMTTERLCRTGGATGGEIDPLPR